MLFFPVASFAKEEEKRVVIVAYESKNPPLSFFASDENEKKKKKKKQDEPLIGFSVDLLNAIAKVVNIKIEHKGVVWTDLYSGLDREEYQVICGPLKITEKSKELMVFSKPYYVSRQLVVALDNSEEIKKAAAKKAAAAKVEKSEETKAIEKAKAEEKYLLGQSLEVKLTEFEVFKKGTIGLVENSITHVYSTINSEMADTTIKLYKDFDLLVQALLDGEIPAAIVDEPQMLHYVEKNGKREGKLEKRVRLVERVQTDFQEEFVMAALKGEDELIKLLNDGLEEVRKSGEYKTILDKWIKEDAEVVEKERQFKEAERKEESKESRLIRENLEKGIVDTKGSEKQKAPTVTQGVILATEPDPNNKSENKIESTVQPPAAAGAVAAGVIAGAATEKIEPAKKGQAKKAKSKKRRLHCQNTLYSLRKLL